MNLAQVLHFVNMNRNSYNTLDRRVGGLTFMRENQLPPEQSQSAYDRYNFTHAAALACVMAFVDAGVSTTQAAVVVTDLFPYIDSLVADMPEVGRLSEDRAWLTIVNYGDDMFGFSGGADEPARTLSDVPAISRTAINFNAVWLRMAMRFGAPVMDENKPEPVLGVRNA